MNSNRTVTGHWDGETISRPKTLGERHPDLMKPKSKALEVKKISKEEILAKFKARHGGAKTMALNADKTRDAMKSHISKHGSEMSSKDKTNYQHRTGRAYSE